MKHTLRGSLSTSGKSKQEARRTDMNHSIWSLIKLRVTELLSMNNLY